MGGKQWPQPESRANPPRLLPVRAYAGQQLEWTVAADHTGCRLGPRGGNLESRLDQEVGRLSGGERQLLAVIMGVMQEPSVLLLDEHTSALDPHIGALVMRLTDELVRKQGLTTIMMTHNMRYAAQFGDRLLIMSGGVIVDDIRADEKRGLSEDSLIRRFRDALAGELTDRLIGA